MASPYPNQQYPMQQQQPYGMQQPQYGMQNAQYAQPMQMQYGQQPMQQQQPQYYGQPQMQYVQPQQPGMMMINSPMAAGMMQPPNALTAIGQMGAGTVGMAAPIAPAGTPPGLEYFAALDHIWVKEMPQMLDQVTTVELNQMYQCLNNQVSQHYPPSASLPSPTPAADSRAYGASGM